MTKPPRILKLMPELHCWCVWNADPDSDQGSNIDPDTLALSADLKSALRAWSEAFDRSYNLDDPLSSGFDSAAEEAAFRQEGQRLLERLRQETPSVTWLAQLD